ncbi:MAG: histidine phosphatase family protein [Desulfobacterales bacterium]|jgi:probable phosphoglycerate mutase|nr:histidine phosphatase family protein [Desulfobacterales bacterium]
MSRQHPRCRFGVIRHAETVWNSEKRIQGQQDSPLTSRGELQAKRWGTALQAFPWNRILSSDSGRAVATAQRINAHLRLPLTLEPRLRELDWGRWTAKTIAQLRAEEADLVAAQERAGWDFQPPGGESRRSQLRRCRRALLDAAAAWPGATILVVAHGGVIRSLVHGLQEHPIAWTAGVGRQPYRLNWVCTAEGSLRLDGADALEQL